MRTMVGSAPSLEEFIPLPAFDSPSVFELQPVIPRPMAMVASPLAKARRVMVAWCCCCVVPMETPRICEMNADTYHYISAESNALSARARRGPYGSASMTSRFLPAYTTFHPCRMTDGLRYVCHADAVMRSVCLRDEGARDGKAWDAEGSAHG